MLHMLKVLQLEHRRSTLDFIDLADLSYVAADLLFLLSTAVVRGGEETAALWAMVEVGVGTEAALAAAACSVDRGTVIVNRYARTGPTLTSV